MIKKMDIGYFILILFTIGVGIYKIMYQDGYHFFFGIFLIMLSLVGIILTIIER
ncbi:hypothetical protein [Paenibacillus faecalis]|uniref:hypothetical protein n=1 Tax=Paenibacillus faecalis TaxID=2079532 RepID=UPI00131A4D2E|nr:hypothetical protein [Paenibacillus faecalis]